MLKILKRFSIFAVLALALSLTTIVASAQDEPVTLNLWIFEGEDVFLPPLIAAFQAQHPNITVQVTDIPEVEYITKIDTALMAGEPPDLGFIYEPRWVASGNFIAIDDMLAANGISVDDYNAGAMSNCAIEGHVYCLGTYTGAVLLFYNKDMLDAAGIPYPAADVPMTIDEYADMALKLTVQSDNIEEKVWGSDATFTFWWMDPGNFFSEDGRTTIGYLNDEATVHAHQVLADMRAQGSALTSSEASLVEGSDLFATGKLATSIIDNVITVPLMNGADIRWGAAVPPVEKAGDPPYIAMWSDGLGVFSASAHPEEAQLFVAFMGTVGNELRLQTTGDLPLNMKLAQELNWAGDDEGRQEILAAVQTSRRPLFIPSYGHVMESPISEAFDGYIIEDGMSAQEAFDEIAPIVQERLDEAWATWDQIQPVQ